MDDRFYSEGTNKGKSSNSSLPPNPYSSQKKSTPGDFSVNIKSDSEINSQVNAPKKFEVHIADFDSFNMDMPKTETPSYTPYGQKASGEPQRPLKPSAEKKTVPTKREPQKKFDGTMVFNTKKTPVKKSSAKKAEPKRHTASVPMDPKKAAPKKKPEPKKTAPAAKKTNLSKQHRKYNFIKGVLTLCVCVIFITIMTVTVSSVALATINDILVINKSSAEPVSVEIPADSDFEAVFDILADKGLVKQPIVTKLFCKFRHYDEVTVVDKATGNSYKKKIEYEPGSYFLDVNSGIEANLEEIMVRKNVAKDTVRLTFPEGWSIARIFDKIEKSSVCSADKLYANLEIVGNKYSFISKIGVVNGRYLKAEGYLFPDTYDFYIGENASSVLKKLFNNFEAKWTEEFENQRKKLGLTVDEVINMAAIIQREAKDSTQMKDISSVIHNRMNNAATYPTLDMNSTKDYVISLKEYNLFSDFYYELYLQEYNTYSEEGLPPGPICNPGISAIKAALFPNDTDYNFFCHSETGEVYYAVTIAEHQQNTNKIIYGK